jgi:hypothetical protein
MRPLLSPFSVADDQYRLKPPKVDDDGLEPLLVAMSRRLSALFTEQGANRIGG